MARGILLVESYPDSPELVDQYHKWYNETHLPEIVELEGFIAARRFEPVGEGGPFVAVYEFETDDIDSVRDRLSEAVQSGRLSAPEGLQREPSPKVRWLREFAAYAR